MPIDEFEPAIAGPRYRATTGGHGNAEPHDEHRRLWTDADVAEFNARQCASRAAYYRDSTDEQTERARKKAIRKAAAQQRLRDRKKAQK